MSRLTDLLAQTRKMDPKLAGELEKTIKQQYNQRTFGLVFERHLPDNVELPSRPVRRGDNVRILPPRGSLKQGDPSLWRVTKISRNGEGRRIATLAQISQETGEELLETAEAEDLVVVARHDEIIYPGMVQTGEVINSEDQDAAVHTVINAENLHALNLLTYTHRHKVDCIYIDPPYNTGAKDWKYNNDYVDGEDAYRHSKWLSFMEKRLELAKELLNPEDSVLIVTIDEKEYLRLGILLEQMFPAARIQMVSSVINPSGSQRRNMFWRSDEYIFFVMLGSASPVRWFSDMSAPSETPKKKRAIWNSLRRRGSGNSRSDRPGCFYPVYVRDGRVVEIGDTLEPHQNPGDEPDLQGAMAIYPIKEDGTQSRNECTPEYARQLLSQGYLRYKEYKGKGSIQYLRESEIRKIEEGVIVNRGTTRHGFADLEWNFGASALVNAKTHWAQPSHDADQNGSRINRLLLPDRRFPFPKSLYAVEDALRFFVKDKPDATVLDFFSGSGTTAHAVMRLNKQDGGRRRSISVTNNEVSFDEAKKLTREGFRAGDPEWERFGICDYVTKPRIRAAITGRTPQGEPIKGDYKFTDEFPMADGFDANARFFTLTYEPPTRVQIGRAFDRIAPLLWMRAGQFGRIIDSIPDCGWEVVESYGVLARMAETEAFSDAVRDTGTVTTVYIVTDDDLLFQSAIASMSDLDVEFVQLYSSYLTNFSFTSSQGGA